MEGPGANLVVRVVAALDGSLDVIGPPPGDVAGQAGAVGVTLVLALCPVLARDVVVVVPGVEAEGVEVELVVFDGFEGGEDAAEALAVAVPVEVIVHGRHHAAAEGAHIHEVARIGDARPVERAEEVAPGGRGDELAGPEVQLLPPEAGHPRLAADLNVGLMQVQLIHLGPGLAVGLPLPPVHQLHAGAEHSVEDRVHPQAGAVEPAVVLVVRVAIEVLVVPVLDADAFLEAELEHGAAGVDGPELVEGVRLRLGGWLRRLGRAGLAGEGHASCEAAHRGDEPHPSHEHAVPPGSDRMMIGWRPTAVKRGRLPLISVPQASRPRGASAPCQFGGRQRISLRPLRSSPS